MDKFDQYEQDGRSLFKSILDQCRITDQHSSVAKFDCIDYYYSQNGNVGVEIKKRGTQCHSYPSLMMEVAKFKAIAARVKSGELDRAYYVSFIGDDTAYIFNLKAIAKAGKEGKLEITTKYAPVTTAADNGKRDKRVLLIPKSVGVKLVRKGDKWIIKR